MIRFITSTWLSWVASANRFTSSTWSNVSQSRTEYPEFLAGIVGLRHTETNPDIPDLTRDVRIRLDSSRIVQPRSKRPTGAAGPGHQAPAGDELKPMRDVYPTPPTNPARTIELRVQIHLPAGSRIDASPLRGETEEASMARWLTEALNLTFLPAWTTGPVGRSLVMPIRKEGGAR